MTNTELLAKLKAEIERLKGICTAQIKANPGQTFPFVMEMTGYDKILFFLDTIEKSNSKDFPTTDEEIKQFLATHPKVELPEKYKTPDWMFEKSEEPMQEGLEEDLTNEADKMFFRRGFYEGDNHEPLLDCVSLEEFRGIARHFAEFGAASKCKGCNNAKGCVTCINGDQWAHYEESEKPMNQGEERLNFQEFAKEMSDILAVYKSPSNPEEEQLDYEWTIARHFAQWGAEHLKQ